MPDIKNILGLVATFLVFLGYIPYLRDIVKGKTKPHLYSWFIWSFNTLLIFALQVGGGAGIGSLVTLSAALVSLTVLFLGIKSKNRVVITREDTIFLLLALTALGLWLVVKQPILSAVLATVVDISGFLPTVRKSWKLPFSETLVTYVLNSVRFGLTILSLQHYSIVTFLYPSSWFVLNFLFVLMLIIRRKQIVN